MQPLFSILVIGLNHKVAPLEVREKIVGSDPFKRAEQAFYPKLISELVGLSTCNRTELYVVTTAPMEATGELSKLFDYDYAYVLADEEATTHLYRVISGLDSMVLGEYDIVAQVKQAYFAATQARTVGAVLHQLFQRAIRASKMVRSSTNIGTGITSLARAAVEQAKVKIENLKDQPILILGAGSMAEKVGKYLAKEGASDITFANRTYLRAEKLAALCRANAIPFERLESELQRSAIIICATAAPQPVITHKMLLATMNTRPLRSLHIIDLAVPRDVEPSVASIATICLYNVDTLQNHLEDNKQERIKAVAVAQSLIEIESQKFWAWNEARNARQKMVTVL